MRSRTFIFLAAFLAVLIVSAVGAYAYDSSRDDKIAKGVTVAGVDVGGMRAGRAREIVKRRVAGPLERPLTLRYRARRFTLSATDARLRADVGGMVDEALQESRQGNLLTRVARDLTGGSEDVQVPARVSYSRSAVEGLVSRVAHSLDRPARDAQLDFPSLARVKEQNGRKVDRGSLEQRIEQALAVPGVGRHVKVPVTVTRPKVTRDELADRYPKLIVVNRSGFKLTLYKRLRQVKGYTIAVGQAGLETPAGLYRIQNKQVNPSWHVPNSSWAGSLAGRVIPPGPDNPIKSRWMGIYNGAGIHGTDELGSLGTAASHGCIRMAIPDVEQLFGLVDVGTPVYVF